ncbi:MAG: anaerobic ribonucleoside-triphosphate reductase activating protein [Anaeroplasmataceae bacterium]
MHYGSIKEIDIANGPGLRVSLFVSGCRIHCPGCFNKDSQNFDYGEEFNLDTITHIKRLLNKGYIHGLTILGGEPMEVENQVVLNPFVQEIKKDLPTKSIWLFTGYDLEHEILPVGSKLNIPEVTEEFIKHLDTIVDGRFVEELKDIKLAFRGSSNQNIIRIGTDIDDKITLENISNLYDK